MTWAADAWGGAAWAAPVALPQPAAPPAPPVAALRLDPRMGGAIVWIAEIEAAREDGTLPTGGQPWASDAWGAPEPPMAPAGGAETVRVSDLGWRAREDAPGGAAAYPPLLMGGPDIERRVALAPDGVGTYAWGALRVARHGLIPGGTLSGRDTALRPVRIRAGQQGWDAARGLVTDPAADRLLDVFRGLALTWQPDADAGTVPLRDPTAWLDQPIGTRRFAGTGGAEGPASLAGTPFPMVRGGSALAPVRAAPVVLVDAAACVYRWTDGAGTCLAVLEDGAPVYTAAGDVPDLWAASPAAGTYVTCNALGMVRLGSTPAGTITVDGHAGAALAATVLRDLLRDTLALPAGMLDEGSVLGAAAVAPWPGGWAWTGQETGREAVAPLMAALNARLVASRSGGLRLWPLRALDAAAQPVAVLDPDTAVDVAPVALDGLMPPAAAWTVGYARTHSTTTSPKPTVSAADRERLAQEWRTQAWADAGNLLRYAQAARPALVGTALLAQADAAALAGVLGALWGVPRSLWRVGVPAGTALALDLGDVVRLRWPADGLDQGPLGQVVGDTLRAADGAAAVLVLV